MNDLEAILNFEPKESARDNKNKKSIDWDKWFPFNLECIDPLLTMGRNSHPSLIILLYICSVMDRKRNCIITNKSELCREVHFDTKTLTKALKVLEEYKFISIERKGTSLLIFVNPHAFKKTNTTTVLKYGGFSGGACSIPDTEKYIVTVPKESISSGFITRIRSTVASMIKDKFMKEKR